MSAATAVNWHQETTRYDRPHPRLRRMARLLAAQPQRRLLDVGCSTAAMQRILPQDFEYFGCDITDHARATLGPERFRQIDFNQSCDLSAFAGQRIDLIHIGGVLEYLHRPSELLASLHKLITPSGKMVVSIINFEERRYRDRASHHPGWVFKPTLNDFRTLLQSERWSIQQEVAFFGRGALRDPIFALASFCLGADHAWVRNRARQFILTAVAQ